MASDWRVIPEPLGKYGCLTCGLAARAPTDAIGPTFYQSGYALYAHAPGGDDERARQSSYASWIASVCRTPPARILDVGCGNGSLLLELRQQWPRAELLGCDPSAASINRAPAGVSVWHGDASKLPGDMRANLITAVNVMEHTVDPVAFLTSLRAALAPSGRLVIVCPDGGRPNVELLIADHLSSLTSEHVQVLLAHAALACEATQWAPETLGSFHMSVARAERRVNAASVGDPASLLADRRGYLERWLVLGARLESRLPEQAVCFGMGEAAGLLRAYTPGAWRRIFACTADRVASEQFGDRVVLALEDVPLDAAILVGVRPEVQEKVAARLRRRFSRVITWYDLIQGPYR